MNTPLFRLIVVLAMLFPAALQAQADKPIKKFEPPIVDVLPEFKGGPLAWNRFMQKNLKYPLDAQRANIEGKVFLRFLVTEKGEITKIEEIKSPSESLTKAAIQMLQKSPKWKPAKLNGKRLDCPMQIQVVFKLK